MSTTDFHFGVCPFGVGVSVGACARFAYTCALLQFDRNCMNLALLRGGKDLMTLVRFSNSDLESCSCAQYLLNSWIIDVDRGVASVFFSFLKTQF